MKNSLKIHSLLVSRSKEQCLGEDTDCSSGHYTATHHSAQSNNYESNPDLGITVTVDETFDNDHRVVSTKGSSQGTFTFTAADAGDHRICFTPSGGNTGGWFSGGAPHGNVKLNLDLAIGETNSINNGDKGKLSEIAQKVKDLNAKLQDIKREQIFQRVSACGGSLLSS